MTNVEVFGCASDYFTISRSNNFGRSTSPHMLIKRIVNGELDSSGRKNGSGKFMADVLSSYVLTKIDLSLIIETIVDFSGIAFFTSE